MLVFLALGDAKWLSFALGDAKVPDARYFAFWWNIGFSLFPSISLFKMSTLLLRQTLFELAHSISDQDLRLLTCTNS